MVDILHLSLYLIHAALQDRAGNVLEIDRLDRVSSAVVEAARESLVIGTI